MHVHIYINKVTQYTLKGISILQELEFGTSKHYEKKTTDVYYLDECLYRKSTSIRHLNSAISNFQTDLSEL